MNRVIKKTGGFTLIELLVVVAIISLLSSVVLASFNSARAKARDSKRFADLHQLQIALNLYYNSNNSYILERCTYENDGFDGWAGDWSNPDYKSCWADLQNRLLPFMPNLPLDPLNGQGGGFYTYWYGSIKSGQGYVLLAGPETSKNQGDKCYDPASGWYCIGENWQ